MFKKTEVDIKIIKSYLFVRIVSSVLIFVGMLLVIAGVTFLLFNLIGLNYDSNSPFASVVAVYAMQYGFAFGGMVLAGLILTAIGQVVLAVVDNTEHTREILILVKQNMISAGNGSRKSAKAPRTL